MRERCYKPYAGNFIHYGGRGITICDRWRSSFANFLSDMGQRPVDHSIERRDNDGNYEPGNCYWLHKSKQQANRRGNLLVQLAGETITVAEASRRLGIKASTIRRRIHTGSTIYEALRPVRSHRKVEYQGKLLTIGEAAVASGTECGLLMARVYRGWPTHHLFDPPSHKKQVWMERNIKAPQHST